MSLYGFTGLQKEGKAVLVVRVAVHVLLLKATHEGWRTSNLVQVKLCSSLVVPSFYFSYYNAIDFPLFTAGPLKITGRYELLLAILLNQLIFSCVRITRTKFLHLQINLHLNIPLSLLCGKERTLDFVLMGVMIYFYFYRFHFDNVDCFIN